MIQKAYQFAAMKHDSQKRRDGSPYIDHPKTVMEIIGKFTKDEAILSAALLHDILEDTGTTYEELKNEFSKRVADMVLEVTKDDKGKFNIRTRGGLMIKLADMLHNVSDDDVTYKKKLKMLGRCLNEKKS